MSVMREHKAMKQLICVVILLFSISSYGAGRSEFSIARRGVATVMISGLGGAVLGISTLSFYGRPEEHVGNIYLGLGLGLIAGMTYLIASPRESDYSEAITQAREFERHALISSLPNRFQPSSAVPSLSWRWEIP